MTETAGRQTVGPTLVSVAIVAVVVVAIADVSPTRVIEADLKPNPALGHDPGVPLAGLTIDENLGEVGVVHPVVVSVRLEPYPDVVSISIIADEDGVVVRAAIAIDPGVISAIPAGRVEVIAVEGVGGGLWS
jgi:hypothetical protein